MAHVQSEALFAAEHAPALGAAFAGRMSIGCALGGLLPDRLNRRETELVSRHFNVLTPENCMKPRPVHPEPGRYDFAEGDALVAFAEARGMAVVGHTLVWHNQSPAWLYAAGMGRSEALEQMRQHIHAVAGHYRGRLQGWDVVNEAVVDEGEYLRATPALAAIGPDYLERAFEFARAADDGAELYYNDYSIEVPGKRERTLRLLRQLQASNVRLDGVGIQGHWVLDQVPFDDIEIAIQEFSALGLKVMITELDLDVVGRKEGAMQRVDRAGYDPYREGCPPDVLLRQGEQYARLFELFLKHAISRVTFWGPHDGESWLEHWPDRRTNHPLLFDRQCRPKPAFERVLEAAARSGR